MKDYSNYRSHIQNDMITYSGNFHFQQQLKQEGSHVTVNFEKYFNKDIKDKYFMIIRNSTNENKENLEERTIMAYKKYNLKTGDIIEYLNEYFIISTHVDKDNPFFDTCKMIRCDKIITWTIGDRKIICPSASSSVSSYQTNVDNSLVTLNELSTIKIKLMVSTNINEYNSIPNWIHFTNLYPEDRFWITQRVDNNITGIMELICVKDIFNDSIDVVQFIENVEDNYGITRDEWKITKSNVKANINHIITENVTKEWGYDLKITDIMYIEEIDDIQESTIIKYNNKFYDVVKIIRCKNPNLILDSYYKVGLIEKEYENIIEGSDN